MPPALSLSPDQDSDTDSEGSEIPADGIATPKETIPETQEKVGEDSDNKDDNEDSEEDEDVYEVEAIRSHQFFKGKLLMSVKWKGYPEDQNTEESEEMLAEGASEILQQYFESIGGRPQPPAKAGKRKSSSNLKTASDTPAQKRSRRANGGEDDFSEAKLEHAGSWVPKKSNWENEIASVDTVERDQETGKLWALVQFTNNKRSRVGMDLIHKRCPLAMLRFYESHLRIGTSRDDHHQQPSVDGPNHPDKEGNEIDLPEEYLA